MLNVFRVTDGSYSVLCIGDNTFKDTNNLCGRKFNILAIDCVLPSYEERAWLQGSDVRNDTIIKDVDNGEIIFIQRKYLRAIVPKQIVVGGKEYSEETIISALREYLPK